VNPCFIQITDVAAAISWNCLHVFFVYVQEIITSGLGANNGDHFLPLLNGWENEEGNNGEMDGYPLG
jgi:hypothetical protein